MKLSGGKVYGFSRSNLIDVANYEEVEGALHSVWEKEGNIDYVINTSGQLSIQKLETMKSNEIGQMTMTNYLGSVYITKASIPYLKHSKGSVTPFASGCR